MEDNHKLKENIGGNGDASQNGNHTEKKEEAKPPTDFKIAEVWIRDGQIVLDAPPSFWDDRCRALGVMEYCKDIIKNAKLEKPKPEKNKLLIPQPGLNMKDFVNGLRKKR